MPKADNLDAVEAVTPSGGVVFSIPAYIESPEGRRHLELVRQIAERARNRKRTES